jgi:hypothetical protein
VPVTLTDNVFSGNQVTDGCGCVGEGGAVWVVNQGGAATVPLNQTSNSFVANSVGGASGDVDGGAETAIDMVMSSSGDSFVRNSLRAPVPGSMSAGAALSLQNDCTAPGSQHVASNLVMAGNSIGAGGSSADARGALSLGCVGAAGEPISLALNNSTISGNSGGGGTAGIAGDPTAQLTARNSIVTGNSDGADLTGFSSGGGSVTAAYADLCSGSSPAVGPGNICAAPALVGASRGDVHETYSSPTVDAGSNALVPSGLTTDLFGKPRIQPKFVGRQPLVDIGAAELTPIGLPSVSITIPANGAVYTEGQAVTSSFSCSEGAGGPGISSCLDQSGLQTGTSVDTATPGSRTFTATASSADGESSRATSRYTVLANNTFRVEHLEARPHGVVTFDLVLPHTGQTSVLETAWNFRQARAAAIGPQVPGPRRFAFARRDMTNPTGGTFHVTIVPDKRGRLLVAQRRNRRVRINLWITYQPTAGKPRTVVFLGFRVRTPSPRRPAR